MGLATRMKKGIIAATAAAVLALSATCNPTPAIPPNTPIIQPTSAPTATSTRPEETPDATGSPRATEAPGYGSGTPTATEVAGLADIAAVSGSISEARVNQDGSTVYAVRATYANHGSGAAATIESILIEGNGLSMPLIDAPVAIAPDKTLEVRKEITLNPGSYGILQLVPEVSSRQKTTANDLITLDLLTVPEPARISFGKHSVEELGYDESATAYRVIVEVVNGGGRGAEGVEVLLNGSRQVVTLEVGESKALTYDVEVANGSGLGYDATAILSGPGTVENGSGGLITAPSLADIVATGISETENYETLAGRKYDLAVAVSNSGGREANNFSVALLYDGQKIAESEGLSLSPGAGSEVLFEGVELPFGSQNVEVAVDNKNAILESDEGNSKLHEIFVRPNPVLEYALNAGLSEGQAQKLREAFSSDGGLSQLEAGYIDRVASADAALRNTLISYVMPGLSAQDISTVDAVVSSGFDILTQKAVLSLPAELDFTRNGLSASELEAITLTDDYFAKDAAYRASRHSIDNLAEPDANMTLQSSMLKAMKITSTANASGKVNGMNYDTDDFHAIDDALGFYPGSCVLCMDDGTGERKSYVTFEERQRYFATITSDAFHMRRMATDRTLHAFADKNGLLVRPLSENTSADYDEYFYVRKPDVRGGTRYAFASQNYPIYPLARDETGSIVKMNDGSGRDLNMFNLTQWILENRPDLSSSPEKAFWIGAIGYGMEVLEHTGKQTFESAYSSTSAVPENPNASEVWHIGVGGSATFRDALKTLGEAAGFRTESGTSAANLNMLTAVINDTPFYGEGNDFNKRITSVIKPCDALTSNSKEVDEITLLDSRRYAYSLCNFG